MVFRTNPILEIDKATGAILDMDRGEFDSEFIYLTEANYDTLLGGLFGSENVSEDFIGAFLPVSAITEKMNAREIGSAYAEELLDDIEENPVMDPEDIKVVFLKEGDLISDTLREFLIQEDLGGITDVEL
jgi:hypothetical protein